MAVRLRLRRIGKKKNPLYHIVAADSRAARGGKFLEVIGRYEPGQKPALIETKDQRVLYWLKNGAHPTVTVRSLLQRSGLWLKWNLSRRGLDENRVAAEIEKWQMAQTLKRQREEARRTRRAAARKKARKATPEAAAAPAPAPEKA